MIPVLILAVVALVTQAVLHDRSRRADAARVNDLLLLLQSKAAPVETAAYLHPFPAPEPEEYLWSEDGLIGVRTEPEPA